VAERAAHQKTTLTAYFVYNAQNVDGRNVVYADFLASHVLKIRKKVWSVRQRREKVVGQMYFVHPAVGERFFLRLLLTIVPGATSFEHLQTVDDIEHPTFQVACKTLGLLQDDAEWDTCMREACIDQDAKRLRNLFMALLLFCSPLNPKVLWERYQDDMSHDMRHRRITNGGTADNAYNDNLLLLEAKLALTNKGLHDFPKMSLALPPVKMMRVNPQLDAEFDYDRDVFHGYINQNLPLLNICQEIAVTTMFNAIAQGEGAVFFLDSPSGSSKTFVYKVLLALVQRDGHVTIGVASSITALLLEGGRTAHSIFKIPIALGRDSMCSIPMQSDSTELFREAKLIVWDEAPTQHQHCAEVIDRTLRDIMRRPDSPFGGKVVVFGGDFRQCPPVVSRGFQVAIISAALSHSILWR